MWPNSYSDHSDIWSYHHQSARFQNEMQVKRISALGVIRSLFFFVQSCFVNVGTVCQSVHQGVGGAGGAQDSGATLEILSMEWRSCETKRRVSASSSSWLEVDRWVDRQTDRQTCYTLKADKSLIPTSFMNFHKYQDICKTWRCLWPVLQPSTIWAAHVWASPFKSFCGSHTNICWHILTGWRSGRGLLSCSDTPMPTERCVSSSWQPQTQRPLDCRSLTAESPPPPESHRHTHTCPCQWTLITENLLNCSRNCSSRTGWLFLHYKKNKE